MAATRVFISGLPPGFSNEELKKHFSSSFQVTDAQVVSRRRIGFVGFKDADSARKAAKYFDKSYIRMSKISVEIARPTNSVDSQQKPFTARKSQNDSVDSPSLKRKRDANDAQQDPKLQEYLNVMQQSSKTRTWANDEGVNVPSTLVATTDIGPDINPDGGLEESQRKKGKEMQIDDQAHRRSKPEDVNPSQIQPVANLTGNRDTGVEKVKLTESHPEELPSQSDADWLRSKTSRLLGLLDEKEEAEQADMGDGNRNTSTKDGSRDYHPEEILPDQHSIPDEVAMDTSNIDANSDLIRTTGRLFVRNLAYSASEADLQPLFSRFGKIEEIHVAFDIHSASSKGFAYVQYVNPDSAIEAYTNLDGSDFQGRLLHILPASTKKSYKIDEYELAKLPIKKQKQIKRKTEASSSSFNWNSLYMNADAVISSVAERLGVSKAEILDPTSSDAAVRQAHAETNVIQETKSYFAANGVNLDSFKQRERGQTAILVKNFSFGIKASELKSLFEPYGQMSRFLMPPHGTIAIVEFARASDAQTAFKSLAYRKIGDSIFFLERAPKDIFEASSVAPRAPPEIKAVSQGFSTTDTYVAEENEADLVTSSLFIRNLNFSTSSTRLTEIFGPLDGFVTAKVKTKPDPKHPGATLSMGFGFVEFRTKAQAQAALVVMNGYNLDQHELVVKISHKGMDAASERRKEDVAKKISTRRTKIIIKNLPFQATKKDVRALFGAYGQLRSVRVPKKFDRSARGFAFADFVSAREAENAMDSLKDTHLLGRKLVLEYAAEESIDPEKEIEKIEQKIGQQMDRVTNLQNLTRSERKKFVVGVQGNEGD